MLHDAEDVRVVTVGTEMRVVGHCHMLSICESMPSFICKAVWRLDALSCHPAIVDVNALGPKPSVEVTYSVQHSAKALLSSILRPSGHFYLDHCCQFSWTLDAVTLDDFGKQDAEGQIHVFMRVADLKEVQCARHELASGNQSGQELPH